MQMDDVCDGTRECPPQGLDDASLSPERATVSESQARKTRLDRVLDLSAMLVWGLVAGAVLTAILNGGNALDIGRLVFYTVLIYLFLRRRPAMRKGAPWESMLAWGGTIFPMVALRKAPSDWSVWGLLVQGLALLAMIVALLSLGRSFGIAPADRGLVRGGLYRYVRHPLYAAELWFFIGYLMANPSWRNMSAVLIMVGIQVVRALREERLISGYTRYADDVRWRLVPLVW